jgi:hypothetical protein
MRLGLATCLGVLLLAACSGGTSCCANGSVCVADICTGGSCPPTPLCGGTCCGNGTVCLGNSDGTNQHCATVCTDSTVCPSDAPCCGATGSVSDAGVPLGFCVSSTTHLFCLCKSASECSTGCCAPSPATPGYVCAPDVPLATQMCCNDGGAFLATCCCMTSAYGGDLCVKQCTNDSQCGGELGPHCTTYVGPAPGSTCVGNMACGL